MRPTLPPLRRALLGLSFALPLLACTCADRCAPSKVVIEAPPRGATSSPAPSHISTLTLPLRVALDPIQDSVRAQVPTELVKLESKEIKAGVLLDLTVTRTGDVDLSAEQNSLLIDLPAKVDAAIRLERAKKRDGATIHGALLLHLRMRPTLDEQWRLHGNSVVSHSWTKRPELSIGRLDVDVQKPVDKAVESKLGEAARKVDAQLLEADPVGASLKQLWSGLANPRPLEGGGWLVFTPNALYASDPEPRGEALHFTTSLQGKLAVVLGERPKATDPGPLPDRGPAPKDARMRLALPVQLEWARLKAALEPKVVGRTEKVTLTKGASGTFQVNRIVDVYSSEKSVAIGIEASFKTDAGDLEITAWMLGEPVLRGRTLTVENFRYVAGTDNAWADAAHALVAEDLRQKMAEKLVFPLDEKLDAAEARLNQQLKQLELGRGLKVQGKVQSLELEGIRLSDEAVIVDVEVTGRLAGQLSR